MAYNSSGTNGPDVINNAGETGPGTIAGLQGDDQVWTGTGPVFVDAGSGNDTVTLQPSNSGTVIGGADNDSIGGMSGAYGTLSLLGNEGNDTVDMQNATTGVLIAGGNDSNDGADRLLGGSAADFILGNGGNDTIVGSDGDNSLVGGVGDDVIADGTGGAIIFGNEGNDTAVVGAGDDTVFLGQGNDSLDVGFAAGNRELRGNEGNDTIGSVNARGSLTIVGGNDSADGSDSITGSIQSDLLFGNGGDDVINGGIAFEGGTTGTDTIVGGFGNDRVSSFVGIGGLLFGNEGDDTVQGFAGTTTNVTVFGGQGNDCVSANTPRASTAALFIFGGEGSDTIDARSGTNNTIFGGIDASPSGGPGDAGDFIIGAGPPLPNVIVPDTDLIFGGGGDDTIYGRDGADTLSGDDGADVFQYFSGADDGNNAAGGGPIEWITDANLDQDKIDTPVTITFASDVTGVNASDLTTAATIAIAQTELAALGNGPTAAGFSFNGRSYLAIDLDNSGSFADASDVLVDVTGRTGTLDAADFI